MIPAFVYRILAGALVLAGIFGAGWWQGSRHATQQLADCRAAGKVTTEALDAMTGKRDSIQAALETKERETAKAIAEAVATAVTAERAAQAVVTSEAYARGRREVEAERRREAREALPPDDRCEAAEAAAMAWAR